VSFLNGGADRTGQAEVVRLTPERGAEIIELDQIVWAASPTAERARLSIEALDMSRTIGVEEPGGRLAAIASAWAFDTPVPGGRVDAGGLTWVGVRPECRRRGYLRALVERHWADCRERGEAVSMLFSSQLPIYGRFGYGTASSGVGLTLPKGASLRPLPESAKAGPAVDLRFETVSFEAHGALVDAIEQQAGYGPARRPGWTACTTSAAWRLMLEDEKPAGPRLEAGRIAISERAGLPTGYALVRRDGNWESGNPAGTLTIRAFQALDPASGYALWDLLVNMDLNTKVITPLLTLDDPLFGWLEDWRSQSVTLRDGLHVRLVDLPAALTARRYALPIDLRLAVTDRLVSENAGVWVLQAGPDAATCRRVADLDESETDVSLDIRQLGAIYLGGIGALGLMDAGLIHERTPGAVEFLSRAFRGARDPAVWPVF
jgi:predicted acetyltransferase